MLEIRLALTLTHDYHTVHNAYSQVSIPLKTVLFICALGIGLEGHLRLFCFFFKCNAKVIKTAYLQQTQTGRKTDLIFFSLSWKKHNGRQCYKIHFFFSWPPFTSSAFQVFMSCLTFSGKAIYKEFISMSGLNKKDCFLSTCLVW